MSLDSIRNNNNAPFCCWQFVSRVALASAKLWYSGFILLGLSHCWESWLFPSFHYACPMAISSNLFGYFWGEFQKRKKKHIGLKKRVKTCSCAHKIPSGDLSFIQQKEENWVTSLWITNPHLLCCVCYKSKWGQERETKTLVCSADPTDISFTFSLYLERDNINCIICPINLDAYNMCRLQYVVLNVARECHTSDMGLI